MPTAKTQVTPRISGVLLAAGGSRRLGRPKLLEPVQGKPILLHTLANVVQARLHEVIVVTGAEHEAISQALAGDDVTLVHNRAYAEGMGTSIRAGVQAVDDTADGLIILLADQPLVKTSTLQVMVERFATGYRGIIACRHTGYLGCPTLFARRYFPMLSSLQGDVGAKRILQEHTDDVDTVEISETETIDVDTESGLVQFRQLVAQGEV